MGWSISLLVNTVNVPEECAKELFESQDYEGERWYELEDVLDDGKLAFNSDHMEHMDYVGEEAIQDILRKYNVAGDICFGSLDGDNAGSFWGYRFDGSGGMIPLEGRLQWFEGTSE
jgi:hypothetical protein